MQYTQAQIDRANAVSLEDFLRTQGETLIKSGREYRWKEHDSLTVRGSKWFRHSQSKGGYPIDFVMEFYGKSFPEADKLHDRIEQVSEKPCNEEWQQYTAQIVGHVDVRVLDIYSEYGK